MGGVKKAVAAFLGGAIMVTSAWAGMSLSPAAEKSTARAAKAAPAPEQSTPRLATPVNGASYDPASLPDGQLLVGASKISMKPRPQDYNGTWETDEADCAREEPANFPSILGDDHVANAGGSPWPENPNCIY